jgi:hypothetical protein
MSVFFDKMKNDLFPFWGKKNEEKKGENASKKNTRLQTESCDDSSISLMDEIERKNLNKGSKFTFKQISITNLNNLPFLYLLTSVFILMMILMYKEENEKNEVINRIKIDKNSFFNFFEVDRINPILYFLLINFMLLIEFVLVIGLYLIYQKENNKTMNKMIIFFGTFFGLLSIIVQLICIYSNGLVQTTTKPLSFGFFTNNFELISFYFRLE